MLTAPLHRLRVAAVAALCAAAPATTAALSPEDLRLYGYVRSGIGANLAGGGDQVCFQLPGVGWKYRLGNECETYLEAGLAATLSRGEDGQRFTLYTNLAYVVEGEADFEQFAPALREVWIEAEGVVGGVLEGATVWAGKRFYRRHDVHINDFYFWDVSGPGAGIEDIDLGRLDLPGTLAVGVFRGVTDEIYPLLIRTGPDGEPELVPASTAQRTDRALTRLDLRVYELEVNPDGALTVGLDLRFATGNDPEYEGRTGYGVNVAHFQEDVFGQGGFHKVVLQYGAGSAARLGSAGGTAVRVDGTAVGDADPSEVTSYRVVDQILVEPNLDWSLLADLVWESNRDNDGLGTVIDGDREWLSAGARAVHYVTDHLNIALEYGYDRVSFDGEDARTLHKVTLAPQLAAGRGFWARPVVRAFATWATWNGAAEAAASVPGGGDTPQGLVGVRGTLSDPVFGGTDGWTVGFQVEAWW